MIIYSFSKFYEYAVDVDLKKNYELICNNSLLITELNTNFPTVFKNIWDFKPIEEQLLFTPDDYDILPPWGSNSSTPNYLDVISAEEAWDITTGRPEVILGVNEFANIRFTHEDIAGKVVNELPFNPTNPYDGNRRHATAVAGMMAANTDNGVGLSSIGFNCRVAQGNFTTLVANNSKVINLSWGSPSIIIPPNSSTQTLINDITENQNVVFVAAAGNGIAGNVTSSYLTTNGLAINAENYAKQYHYPASYKNVISVTTVGDTNMPYTTAEPFDNWIDMHKLKTLPGTTYSGTQTLVTESEITHQHNDSVDIAVPGYRLPHLNGDSDNVYWSGVFGTGTSYSTPVVTGTIGLLFSANYCLKPKEVETILKLTAKDIENYPENIEFIGRLGAGRLDAFKAVKMAFEMSKPFGTVIVEDRNLYRNWFYKLESAPYSINLKNNVFKLASKVKFFARNNINIESGDYIPNTGYIDLQINPNLVPNDCTELQPFAARNALLDDKNSKFLPSVVNIKLFPNPSKGNFSVEINGLKTYSIDVDIYDILGNLVQNYKMREELANFDISYLSSGIYIVKIFNNEIDETFKFVKN